MRLSIAVVLVLAGGVLQAQQPAEPIALDVVVEESAQRGALTASDFTVTAAGRALTVESVRLIQSSADSTPLPPITSDDEELAAASAANRLVAVYIDEYHLSDTAAFASARAALAAFLRHALGPRDLVVVMKPLDALTTIRLSADRELGARIVEGAVARQGDYEARSSFERNFIAGAPARIDAARQQIALSSMSALAAHLGRFPAGRKTLIVVSNGLGGRVTPARGDLALPGVDAIVRAANRARVALYALRPSPSLMGPTAASTTTAATEPDLLTALAERTTGFAIDGGDASAAGLQRALRDASRYYLLTLSSLERETNGRFREVSVVVRRPGATFRARAGYGPPRSELNAALPLVAPLPAGLTVPRHTTPLIRAWFGMTARAGGRTQVEFVWEPALLVPVGRGPVAAPARVSVSISTMDGAPVFSGTSNPSGREALVPGSQDARLAFDTAPGTLLVQMDVLDSAGRVLDHDVRDLTVGGFRGPVGFGSAQVFRARTVREIRAVVADEAGIAPVAARQFSRAEHLIVRIPLLSLEGGAPTLRVRLQSRFGNTIREVPATPLPRASEVMQLELPLAGLASGGYVLEFTATNHAGSALDRLEFSVTP